MKYWNTNVFNMTLKGTHQLYQIHSSHSPWGGGKRLCLQGTGKAFFNVL